MGASEETLARFLLHRKHLRQDLTVRPDAFIPHPYPDLSVTRHLKLEESTLWEIGRDVATETGKNLYGRADVQGAVFQNLKLKVLAEPTETNPNHANVAGWPTERAAQKNLAQKIVAAAGQAKLPPAI